MTKYPKQYDHCHFPRVWGGLEQPSCFEHRLSPPSSRRRSPFSRLLPFPSLICPALSLSLPLSVVLISFDLSPPRGTEGGSQKKVQGVIPTLVNMEMSTLTLQIFSGLPFIILTRFFLSLSLGHSAAFLGIDRSVGPLFSSLFLRIQWYPLAAA